MKFYSKIFFICLLHILFILKFIFVKDILFKNNLIENDKYISFYITFKISDYYKYSDIGFQFYDNRFYINYSYYSPDYVCEYCQNNILYLDFRKNKKGKM